MPEEKRPDDEIDEESATVLPNREAMSIIDPSFVTRVLPTDPSQATTGQGIDEGNPEGDA